MTIEKKLESMRGKEFNLTLSEIRKINAHARKTTGKETARVTSWFYSGFDQWGFADVQCEICSGYDAMDREEDITIHCCMFDRRRSFI